MSIGIGDSAMTVTWPDRRVDTAAAAAAGLHACREQKLTRARDIYLPHAHTTTLPILPSLPYSHYHLIQPICGRDVSFPFLQGRPKIIGEKRCMHRTPVHPSAPATRPTGGGA